MRLFPKIKTHPKLIFIALLATAILVPQVALAQTTYYPAQGVWNGFLSQLNVNECDNGNNQAVALTIAVQAGSGEILASQLLSIPANGTLHTDISAVIGAANFVDAIGLYTLTLASGQEALGDKLNCRTVFYRPAAPGSLKQFDYAYSLPVSNPQSGTLAGVYNSFDPANAGNATNNFLSVINLDTKPFSASVNAYTGAGSLDSQQSTSIASLAPGGRVDIPLGHFSPSSGLWEVVPTDGGHLYDAVLIRYNQRPDGNLNFAFPLRGTTGSCTGNPLLASSMANGRTFNWLEIGNNTDVDIQVTVNVNNRDGVNVHNEQPFIPRRGQYAIFLSDKIDAAGVGNVGSVTVTCSDPTDKLIIGSTFYGNNPGNPNTAWAYQTQELGRSPVTSNATITAPVNTFVGMANWFKFADASLAATSLDFNLFNQAGQSVAQGAQGIAAGGTADLGLHSMIGADQIGSVSVSTATSTASYSGEMLRVLSRSDGQIGNIISIPGIVSQNGLSDGSFRGDPQSLAPYRDKLTAAEAQRLLTITSFGGTASDINRVTSDGLRSTITRLSTVNSEPASLRAEAEDWWDNDQGEEPEADDDDFWNHEGIKRWWLTHILKGPNPLKEKLALILHDRFATSCRVLDNNDLEMKKCLDHMDKFRQYAYGNYRDLTAAMTIDYLMLVWLNGNVNVAQAPDENYAREILELFTTGEAQQYGKGMRYPLYTETGDIPAFARAFTGYATTEIDDQFGRQYVVNFVVTRHDSGIKTMWEGTPHEISGRFDPLEAADLPFSQRPRDVGHYLGGALFTAFCHDHPSRQLRNQMADILIRSNWNILPLVRRILMSEACFSQDAYKSRVMDPLTFAVGFLKRTGITMDIDDLSDHLAIMGFDLTNPVDVFGYPIGFRETEHSETSFWNAFPVEYLNFITDALRNADNDRDDDGEPDFDFCSLNPSDRARSDEVVDHLSTLLGTPFEPAERTAYIRYLDNDPDVDGDGNIEEEPELYDARIAAMCEEKLGGILWIATANPRALTY